MACALARCPGRCASRVLRAWLPHSLACPVCCAPGAWAALPAGALVAVLCGWAVCLVSWPTSLPCAGGLCVPCVWACPVGCLAGPYFPALYCGLPGGASEKKALIFALYFSGIFSLDFLPLYAGLYFFLAYFSGFAKSNFFLRIFLRRNFRRIFPDLFFRIFSCPIFATVSGFLFFLDIIFI